MTKKEFEDIALNIGYTKDWVEKVTKKIEYLNKKYNLSLTYVDVVLSKPEEAKDSKFEWGAGQCIVFRKK